MAAVVMSFHYQLKDDLGKVLDSSEGHAPMTFLSGADQIISGLEGALLLLNPGDQKEIKVAHREAYGAYDDSLIYKIPRDQFPPGPIKAGDMFEVTKEDRFRVLTVVEVADAEITLDGNHPLAGKDLTFQVEIVSKREATSDEVAHGHVHGAGGHHH